MRKLLLVIFLLLMVATSTFAYQCEQCPKESACVAYESAGDGCNTASFRVWCENGEWKRGDSYSLTLVYCRPKGEPPSYPWSPPEDKK